MRTLAPFALSHVKFTGQRLDDTTGLYYYGARYYDPALGTFITPDTVIQSPYDPQTLNRYTYCRNNPIMYTDPSGHSILGNILGVASFALNWQNSLLNIVGHAAFGKVNSFSDATRYSYQGQVIGAAVGATVGPLCVMGVCEAVLGAKASIDVGSLLLAAGGDICAHQRNCTADTMGGPGDGPADRQRASDIASRQLNPMQMELWPTVSYGPGEYPLERLASNNGSRIAGYGAAIPLTSMGEESAEWYADRYIETNNPAYIAGGLGASLWTPGTAIQTAATLATGWAVAGWAARTGPWLGTMGIHDPHHGLGQHFEIIIRGSDGGNFKIIIPGKDRFIWWGKR